MAAPRPPDGRPAPSFAGPRSSDTTRALCTRTAPGARARSPRTETAPRRPRTRRRAGSPGTRARRTAAGPPRPRPPPLRAGRPLRSVMGTVSSDDKFELVRKFRADWVVNYEQQDFAAEAMKITDGRRVDLIFDAVGKPTFE